MPPALHHWYTVDEAVAAFGEPQAAEFLCDRQFVIMPDVVLCFATLGEPAKKPYILFPSSFVWKPGRLDYDPTDKIPWLPTKAREVWGPNREKLKVHHVFLRGAGDERFLYVGSAHLGSYGNNGVPGGEEASFSLDVKLPRDAWLRLGGYAGWRVELNHQGDCFLDQSDLAGFQKLVQNLPRRENSHFYMTRYEEDSLSVYLNSRRGWLNYQRSPRDFGIHCRDLEYSGDPTAEEFFECACGIDLEIPAEQTLPHELCLRAAIEFFQTGELPKCVHWESSAAGGEL
jgi:hypothetical protein